MIRSRSALKFLLMYACRVIAPPRGRTGSLQPCTGTRPGGALRAPPQKCPVKAPYAAPGSEWSGCTGSPVEACPRCTATTCAWAWAGAVPAAGLCTSAPRAQLARIRDARGPSVLASSKSADQGDRPHAGRIPRLGDRVLDRVRWDLERALVVDLPHRTDGCLALG